ncbi:MAG: tetratricopeptide repeat protein, partial [Euryarchaeota archaeon]|nr:tetratricopeptide repeat protein [Euryarchaeota archaeon]
FLQLWYTPEEQRELFERNFKLLEAGEKTALRDLCYYAEIQPPEFRAESLLKLAPKLLELGELEEAAYEIRKLKEIVAETGDKELEGKIWRYEVGLLFSEGRYEDALEVFEKVLEINPEDESALSLKGLALVDLGRYEDALKALDKALEINPEDGFALSQKGLALVDLGRHRDAIEILNKALKIDPKDENTLQNKGIALLELKRCDEALDAAEKAKEVATSESSMIDAALIMIKAHISLDRKSDATSEMEKIKDRIPEQEPHLIEDFVETCLNLALDELKVGNPGNASRLMKTAYDASTNLDDDKVAALTMTFLKNAIESGELHIIKAAVDEVIKLQGDRYQNILKPITEAIGIVETEDIRRYYRLQVEEREIVADIVRKITQSDELLPAELRH